MGKRAQLELSDGVECGVLSATIVPLRRREDGPRAERIATVVDAFGRLRGSVLRVVAMLAPHGAAVPAAGDADALRFDRLLTLLSRQAELAGFRRLSELNRYLERAAFAERHRDVIFAQSPPAGDAELQHAAAALERLDAELVALCVAHVLECHPQPAPTHAAAIPRREIDALA
ncbi:hypothetical protein [Burkholderia sp. Ac-20353]|uniref:hypothetical protein n=1 Tax=Burkholderia sp. Ac-20353 TaxID=2703894 RepID=UPI00197C5A0D|nr:hypothetical protein [Burkholderia sp. Ac-20353]MBN3785388.1 hypothetical protein [Burkholderia sp. Ac-20353]